MKYDSVKINLMISAISIINLGQTITDDLRLFLVLRCVSLSVSLSVSLRDTHFAYSWHYI